MTREEFIEVLDGRGYSYEIEGDRVVVTREGDVLLNYLTSLPSDVEFKNQGHVVLTSFTSIPSDVEFNNEGDVLTGDWFEEWEGNIEGIDSKRLLNFMISKGVFER